MYVFSVVGVCVFKKGFFFSKQIIAIGYTFVVAFSAFALWFLMRRENIRRDKLVARIGENESKSQKEIRKVVGSTQWATGWSEVDELKSRREMGDRHPGWRYRI